MLPIRFLPRSFGNMKVRLGADALYDCRHDPLSAFVLYDRMWTEISTPVYSASYVLFPHAMK